MEQFINDLKEWNIDIRREQLKLFEKYTALLLSWNEKINLTAKTVETEVNTVLSNSFGFGGTNSALVIRKMKA